MNKIVLFLLLAALVWLAGLLAFVRAMPAEPTTFDASADAIAVYTGGGGNRIATGMRLLAEGKGERLLISGVNPEIGRNEIAILWTGASETFDCCVDLGLEARTTNGNADELAAWIGDHQFKSVILVTSDFHMRRALIETRMRAPQVEIALYPVRSEHIDANGAPKAFADWRRVAGEYSKYLIVRVRSIVQ